MIEIQSRKLHFEFPSIHKKAHLDIEFERTFRVPDDNKRYSLPPTFGAFPLKHVEDYTNKLPSKWKARGGVFLPMYQSEALWINFSSEFPCAIKISCGKINAVSGEPWNHNLSRYPQNYVVVPEQPWIDGFNVSKDQVRQFTAMPLGKGYSAEEQITGVAEFGGIQILAFPMKKHLAKRFFEPAADRYERLNHWCGTPNFKEVGIVQAYDMGLAPGGLIDQTIEKDPRGIKTWDFDNSLRCYVHLLNSQQYRSVTGENPPTKPMGAKEYNDAGFPWFNYYSEGEAVAGSKTLGGLNSVGAKAVINDDILDNKSVDPKHVINISSNRYVKVGWF